MQTRFIDFRGSEYEVEYKYEYDPGVGIDGVSEWGFTSPGAPEPTDDEYGAIADKLTHLHWQDTCTDYDAD